jgi:hypothetical protein
VLEDAPAARERGGYRVTTDRATVARALPAALALLREEHWGGGVDADTLARGAQRGSAAGTAERRRAPCLRRETGPCLGVGTGRRIRRAHCLRPPPRPVMPRPVTHRAAVAVAAGVRRDRPWSSTGLNPPSPIRPRVAERVARD